MLKYAMGILAVLVLCLGLAGCRDDGDSYTVVKKTYNGTVYNITVDETGQYQVVIICDHKNWPHCWCQCVRPGCKVNVKCKKEHDGTNDDDHQGEDDDTNETEGGNE